MEVAKDFLRQVLQLIEEKRHQLAELKNLIDDFGATFWKNQKTAPSKRLMLWNPITPGRRR